MVRFRKMSLPASILLSAFLLAGCRETMPRPERPSKPPPAHACTREYAPVCAAKGWKRKTFPNACTARADGYLVIADGPCVKDR